MQGKSVFVAMIAAFCAGALIDRVYFREPETAKVETASVPMPDSVLPLSDNGALTMHNCILSATRRGMTPEQRVYACDEIVN
jgi:hypothetical protein